MSHVWRGFRRLIRVEDARDVYLRSVRLDPTDPEEVTLSEALGRVLAEDVVSPVDIPPRPRAALDGYAVRSRDVLGASTESPVSLRLVGEVRAGRPPDRALSPGEAVRIYTGAYLPEGADAVVPVEYSEELESSVEVYTQVPAWKNVARPGEDVKRGEVVLKAGTPLGPHEIGLLAELNVPRVAVRRRPRVAVACTGDEIVEVGDEVPLGKVPNSLRFMVEAMIKQEGGEPIYLGIVEDDPRELAEVVGRARDADLMVTTGGTSVGRADVVYRGVLESGGEILIHGVAAMPGRPALLARLPDGRPWIGLPGYPVAAAVDFRLFVAPVIWRLLGLRWRPLSPVVRGRLVGPIPSSPGVRHFARVRLTEGVGGAVLADPVRVSGSGILSSLVRADGLVEVPEDVEGFPEGSEVPVELLTPYERWREWT